METYKNWYKSNMGIWINKETKEESCFHPQAIEIAAPLYVKASKWCRKAADDKNKIIKDKRP